MRSLSAASRPVLRAASVGLIVAVLTSALVASAQAGITRPFSASSSVDLSNGIRYEKGTMRTSGGIQSVRVATVDPANPDVRLLSLLSNDLVVQRELPTHLVRR